MKPLKPVLAAALAVLLAAPAPAQTAAAVSLAGSARVAALPVVAVPVAFSPASAFPSAPALAPGFVLSAPLSAAPLPVAASAASAAAVDVAPAPSAAAAEGAAAPVAVAAAPSAAAAALAVRAAAPAAPGAEIRSAAASRGLWERFWSGARFAAAPAAVVAAAAAPTRAFALNAAAPAAAKAAGLHVVPLAGAGIVVASAYGLDRGVRWGIGKFAKSLDPHQVAAARLIARVVVWTGAAYLALAVGGASHQVLTTALGAGGTVLTFGLRDLLGNTLQGLTFLFARPFTIGDKVQIDDQVGVVSDLNLTGITIKKDDGSVAKVRHTTLAAKTVITFGPFPERAAHLHFALPHEPKFAGAAGAVWSSLDRGFWLSAAGFAALVAAPHFVPVLAAGAPAKAVAIGLAAALLWVTRRVDRAFTKAVDALAAHNGWRLEARVLGTLGVHVAAWLLGGGAALRIVGLSWATLATSLGLTTFVIGIATNNFFSTVILGIETMLSRPFQLGDRVRIGTNEGAVVDMNFSYVVIQLDENRRLQVPYAVVRDSVVVVQPGNNTK